MRRTFLASAAFLFATETFAQTGGGGGSVINSQAPTYTVAASGFVSYATPTDMFCISGSATKTVRVVNANIYVQSTTATSETWTWLKRSAADTGGAPTTPTPVLLDSASASATAVVNLYTSAPSLGSSAGSLLVLVANTTTLILASLPLNPMNAINGSAAPSTTGYNQPVTLHGVAEQFCLNFNGAALPAGFTSQYVISWTES